VAIKRFKIKNEIEGDGFPSDALREIVLLKTLGDHPNLVKLLNVFFHEKKVYLSFEYLDYDLNEFIKL